MEKIRPVLKEPGEKLEYSEVKLLGMAKQPEKISSSPEKALEFKYSATKKSLVDAVDEYMNKDEDISITKDDFFKKHVSNDMNQEYEDIKNFLELPENQNISSLQSKYNEYLANKNANNNLSNRQAKENLRYNDYVNADFKNVGKTNFAKSKDDNIMQARTKYSSPLQIDGDLEKFDDKYKRLKEDLNKISLLNTDNDYYNFEDEDIDLNKLPVNLKRMIIKNILSKKNYD